VNQNNTNEADERLAWPVCQGWHGTVSMLWRSMQGKHFICNSGNNTTTIYKVPS